MATTKLLLVTGDLEVEATVEQVIKEPENAARSSPGTLAMLRQPETGETGGGQWGQVATVRPGDE